MGKVLRIALSLLILIGVLSLCSCREGGKSAPASIDGVKSSVFESQFPEMVELGKNQLSNYYTFDAQWIKESSVYIADSESLCDEVAIFRLSEEKHLKNVVAAIESKINSQFTIANAQNAAEAMKLSKRVLIRKDDIIVMVISEHGEDIAKRLQKKYGFKEIKI